MGDAAWGVWKGRMVSKWIMLLVAAVLAMGACAACDGASTNSVEDGQSLAATGEIAPQATTLTVEVVAPEWTEANKTVSLAIKGETAEKVPFEHSYLVTPNKKKELNIDPGSYELSISTEKLNTETVFWKATAQKVALEEGDSVEVALDLVHDTEAMEEAAKAAEEKARAEAEEQARIQREAEAAAAAAAAQAAEAQAAQSQKSATGNNSGGGGGGVAAPSTNSGAGGTVYVASSGNGTKYHSNSNCSNMKGTRQLSVSEAQAQGYTACKKCH